MAEDKPKRKTYTSWQVKDRYKKKAYDSIVVLVKKGEKPLIQAHAKKLGESTNGFVKRAISETMQRDNNKN